MRLNNSDSLYFAYCLIYFSLEDSGMVSDLPSPYMCRYFRRRHLVRLLEDAGSLYATTHQLGVSQGVSHNARINEDGGAQ